MYELIELSHPLFSKVYRLVRNNADGLTVTLENNTQGVFEFYPMKITGQHDNNTMDYTVSVTFGDVKKELKNELKRLGGDHTVMPTLIYRVYRSDNLTQPMTTAINLEVTQIDMQTEGVLVSAQARSLNKNRTGEVYNFERFPMLRDFL
jgi:hypothetical protein